MSGDGGDRGGREPDPDPHPDDTPPPRPGEPADAGHDEPSGEEGPGIFPSWGWLYGTVLVWFVVTVVALWVLTVTLDFGTP